MINQSLAAEGNLMWEKLLPGTSKRFQVVELANNKVCWTSQAHSQDLLDISKDLLGVSCR